MRHLPIANGGVKAAPKVARMSLTDRCDLACIYCRPHRSDGYVDERMSFDAWVNTAKALVASGIRRIRITGGEPLLHPNVVQAIEALAALGLDDIALTTNATRLKELARPLRQAGLQRLNISLDTLDADRFTRMTRGGKLGPVLEGIESACTAGYQEIKLNAVIVRGENDAELEHLARYSWQRSIVPRFLEIMAIGEGAAIQERLVTVTTMREILQHVLEDSVALRETNRGPAKYVRSRENPNFKVGFISGTSDTFCKDCDRLRVSSDGNLRSCLATNDQVSIRSAAESDDRSAIQENLNQAWKQKPDGDTWKGCTEVSAKSVSIRAIGG